MINASVVPDSQVILVLPPIANLKIMVLYYQVEKPSQQTCALCFTHFVDPLGVLADGKDALPSCDRIRADDRVDGFDVSTDVFWRTSLATVELEIVAPC